MLDSFYLSSSFFLSIALIKYVSSYRELQRGPMISTENRHNWGKICPTHLLRENGDLSFFFQTVLCREHSGKVSKKFIGEILCLSTHLKYSLR